MLSTPCCHDIELQSHLSIGPHILKETSDASETLIKLMTFFQRLTDGLERPFIFFLLVLMKLFRCSNILFEIATGMLPRLQSLQQEASGLSEG